MTLNTLLPISLKLPVLLPIDQYTTMFGTMDTKDIIEDYRKKVNNWKDNPNSLLISFPGLSSFTNKSIYNSLKMI